MVMISVPVFHYPEAVAAKEPIRTIAVRQTHSFVQDISRKGDAVAERCEALLINVIGTSGSNSENGQALCLRLQKMVQLFRVVFIYSFVK